MLQTKDASLDTPENLGTPKGLVVQKCVKAVVKGIAALHTRAGETAKAEKALCEVLQVSTYLYTNQCSDTTLQPKQYSQPEQ